MIYSQYRDGFDITALELLQMTFVSFFPVLNVVLVLCMVWEKLKLDKIIAIKGKDRS